MEKKSKKVNYSIALGVGAAYFGTQFGPGVSTGAINAQYFYGNNFSVIVMPIIVMAVVCAIQFVCYEIARLKHTYDYGSLYGTIVEGIPVVSKVLTAFYQIALIVGLLVPMGACLAVGASVLEMAFGFTYWVSVLCLSAIALVLAIFGAPLMRKAQKWLTAIMLVSVFAIIIAALTNRNSNLLAALASGGPEEFRRPISSALLSGLTYFGLQGSTGLTMASATMGMTSRKESFAAALSAFIFNSLGFVGMGLALLAFSDVAYGSAVPLLSVLDAIDAAFILRIAYYTFVLLAVISSLNSWLFSQMVRWSPALKKVQDERVRYTIVGVIVLVICCSISTFGLSAIISKGYSYVSTLNLIAAMVPLLIIAPYKLSKEYKKERLVGQE